MLGLIAALSLGLADLFAAVVVRKIGVGKLSVLSHLAAVGVLIALYPLVAPNVSLSLDRWLALIGTATLFLGTMVCFYRGIQVGRWHLSAQSFQPMPQSSSYWL